jgi:hypothetical protein
MLASTVAAADWGHLRGRFVFDGEPPVRKPVLITADKEFCGNKDLLEEEVVVKPDSKGLANVAVWIYRARGEAPLPVHASYAETAKAEVCLDADGCRFNPHVGLLRTAQTLWIRNRNPIGDSAKIDTLQNPPINITLPVGSEVRHSFSTVERMPVRVSCSLHPWECGWLIVRDDPYMGVSDEDGRFQIKDLPVGKWTFQVWHEKAGYVTQVKTREKASTWPRGRVELSIKTGDNDLGEILLSAELFAK